MIDPLSLTHYMTIISTADEGKKLSRYFREGCWSFFLSYFLSSSLSFFLEAVQPSLAKELHENLTAPLHICALQRFQIRISERENTIPTSGNRIRSFIRTES